MTPGTCEQRNPYKGLPNRPWIRVRFIAPDGSSIEAELLADTGNPCSLIIGTSQMASLSHGDAPDVQSNFGHLSGGWLLIGMPELGVSQAPIGYASDTVMQATQGSDSDLVGLAGLPLLRLFEYGGDADAFWLRSRRRKP